MDQVVLTVLFKATMINVVRGHFTERSGLDACPALDEDGNEDLSACDCGIKEAMEALEWCRAMGIIHHVPTPGDWTSLDVPIHDAATKARQEIVAAMLK